jgi:hypothetical protein
MKNVRWRREANSVDKGELEQQRYKGWSVLTILLSLLTLIALLHFIAVVHSAYPTIIANTCDKAIRNANYTQYVPIGKSQEMLAVQFTDTLTTGRPSAMVQVVDKGPQHLLDVYLYGCSMQHHNPALMLLFKQQKLVEGTAAITLAHTLSISRLDTTLTSGGNTFLLPLQENVYQEYAWQDGSLRQISFPGIYPVTSRSEAEALQEQADQVVPWTEPVTTAEQMAQDLLKWSPRSFHSALIDENVNEAHVRLSRLQPSMNVTVSLARLVQPDIRGLWFVTGAQTAGITLNQTYAHTLSTSSLLVQGTVTNGKHSIKVTLFDHTLTPVPDLKSREVQIQSNGSYTGKLHSMHRFPDQPGLLLLEALPPSSEDGHKSMRKKGVTKQDTGQLLLVPVLLS